MDLPHALAHSPFRGAKNIWRMTVDPRTLRALTWELWETSLSEAQDTPIAFGDSYLRNFPQWSPDGKQILTSRIDAKTGLAEAWLLPVSGGDRPEAGARKLISRPPYRVYQSHFSPDGRWIPARPSGMGQ